MFFSLLGTEIVVIDASSQTNDVVTVKPHDSSTAERVKLVPVSVGVNSTYRVLTKQIPDREVNWISSITKKKYSLFFKLSQFVFKFDKTIKKRYFLCVHIIITFSLSKYWAFSLLTAHVAHDKPHSTNAWRYPKSMKDRQHNGQKKKGQTTSTKHYIEN